MTRAIFPGILALLVALPPWAADTKASGDLHYDDLYSIPTGERMYAGLEPDGLCRAFVRHFPIPFLDVVLDSQGLPKDGARLSSEKIDAFNRMIAAGQNPPKGAEYASLNFISSYKLDEQKDSIEFKSCNQSTMDGITNRVFKTFACSLLPDKNTIDSKLDLTIDRSHLPDELTIRFHNYPVDRQYGMVRYRDLPPGEQQITFAYKNGHCFPKSLSPAVQEMDKDPAAVTLDWCNQNMQQWVKENLGGFSSSAVCHAFVKAGGITLPSASSGEPSSPSTDAPPAPPPLAPPAYPLAK